MKFLRIIIKKIKYTKYESIFKDILFKESSIKTILTGALIRY